MRRGVFKMLIGCTNKYVFVLRIYFIGISCLYIKYYMLHSENTHAPEPKSRMHGVLLPCLIQTLMVDDAEFP
jgi:hypothetical protein